MNDTGLMSAHVKFEGQPLTQFATRNEAHDIIFRSPSKSGELDMTAPTTLLK